MRELRTGNFDFYITCSKDFEPSIHSHKPNFWLQEVKVYSRDALISIISRNTVKH